MTPLDAPARWFAAVTTRPFALHGTAALRIGLGLLYLAFLLRELPARRHLWGPHAAWSPSIDRGYADATPWWGWTKHWYTLAATGNSAWFEISYALAVLVTVAFTAGYRTRLTSALFMVTVTAVHGRNIFVVDPSDVLLMLLSVYLVFTACGRLWSVDAFLAARHAVSRPARLLSWPGGHRCPPARTGEPAEVRRRLVVLVHNCAVLVIGFQMCLLYGASGMYKVQGKTWQDGTAMYYVLHIQGFRPWPGLSDWMAGHSLAMAVIAYFTVFVQIGFVFTVFHRKLKYVFLAGLLAMHLGIAVVLGLPWFSAVVVTGDAVFLPESFWQAVGRAASRARPGARRRTPAPAVVPARKADPVV
ncbi:HTTM domain-containing protein [Streptomyces sp. NPDC004031]